MMSFDNSTVCLLGLGYIGLPTAALMASRGWKVIGVDTNAEVVATVAAGRVHIAEPDLEGLVQKMVSAGRMVTRTAPVPADVFIITVPTPTTENHRPDLSFVEAATRNIAPHLREGNLVIIESTCPVGTTQRMAEILSTLRPDLAFPDGQNSRPAVSVAYCPERVLPGRILVELQQNDRSVGGLSKLCTERAVAFYKTFVRGQCVPTNAPTAELVKLSENAFRDTNIAFANELSLICDRAGIDVWEVIALANRHPRVDILKPGPGVGGHCIAVDPWFIIHSAPDISPLMRTAREVNVKKADYTFDRACRALEGQPGKRLASLGLAFKANIDDLRESPALEVTERLVKTYGDRIAVVEPNIDILPENLLRLGARATSLEQALSDCEILLVLVDHDQFREVDRELIGRKTVIDTRGIWRA